MKRFTFTLFALLLGVSTLLFADDDKHELTNYTVSVPATDYKSSRFLEKSETNGKEYIHGKGTSYNKKGEAISGKALWPYADYILSSKLMGGTYTVTVHYRIDKDKAPDNARILLGMDLLEAQELAVEKKLLNTVKATFNTKLLKGKNHTLKVWFPCEGVEIQKFEVRRAIITKKN